MKIALFSTKPYDKAYFEKINKAYNFDISYFEGGLTNESAPLAKGHEAVCVFVNDEVDRACIRALARFKIKIIATRSAGFNHIDLKAAQKHSIKVVRVPEYSPHAVAEHALALLLTLNRKTHKAYNRIRENNYALNGLLGYDLFGKTIGIIGLGKIGKCLATICHGLGMRVLAFDPEPDEAFAETNQLSLVSLNELFKKSDVISLHCPLNQASEHLINDKSIELMKDGVTLINTGRGALIDSKALINGLKAQKIGAVGLDVYEQEANVFFEDHSNEIINDDLLMRLTTFPNVLITSHQGFFTDEAMCNIASTTLQNLQELSEGKPCHNEVYL